MSNFEKNNGYIKVSEITAEIVVLKIYKNTLDVNDGYLLSDSIDIITEQSYRNIIIDLRSTSTLDQDYISILLLQMNKLADLNGSLSLIVTKDNPRFRFSIGNPSSNLKLFLSREKAIEQILDL